MKTLRPSLQRGVGRLWNSLIRAAAEGGRYWYADILVEDAADVFDDIWAVVDFIPGWFRQVNAAALFRVVRSTRPKCVVEIGSYLGRSTVFFARSATEHDPAAQVVAVDPHTGDRQQLEQLGSSLGSTFDLFRSHIDAAGVAQIVTPIRDTSLAAAEEFSGQVDLLFIDGWHGYEAVLADARAWRRFLHDDSVVVFDDFGRYREVHDAVTELDRQGELTLWGNVFGHAYCGVSPTPPPDVQAVVNIAKRPLARVLFSPRSLI